MAYHFLPSGSDLDASDFAAVWRHYEDTGFLYPEKLRRFESQRRDWERLWPLLANASPEVFQFHASHAEGRITGSLSGFRDTDRRFVIQHAASEGCPDKQLECLLAMSVGVSSTSAKYASCYFRSTKRFPLRWTRALAEALPSWASCQYEESHLVFDTRCVESPSGSSIALAVPPDSHLADAQLIDSLRRTWEPVRIDALGLEPESRARLSALYSSSGLEREQTLLVARRGDGIAGIGCLAVGSGPISLSLLCNRLEIALAPETVGGVAEGVVAELIFSAAHHFASKGISRFSVLVDPSVETAAVTAGCRSTGSRYASFVWSRDGALGFLSTAITFARWFETLGSLRQRREVRGREALAVNHGT